ncbi:MAG: MFS transporter, partial [Actinocatenispora sp.]
MFAPYRRILATRHLAGLLAWSLVGRLHFTGTALGLTFLVAGWTGSYTIAGVVTAALTIGMAIGGPLRGRSIDRRPAPRVLMTGGIVYAVGVTVIAVLPAWAWPAAPVLALVSGIMSPPVGSVARVTWSHVPDHTAREATYAAESTLTEVLFVVGPMIAAMLVSMVSARAAVLACAVMALVGSLGFALALRRAGSLHDTDRNPAEALGVAGDGVTGRRGSLLRSPGLVALLVMSLLVIGALSAVDLVLVAWARDRGTPGLAGVLSAVWAIGSATGGLVLGSRVGRQRLAVRAAGTAVGLALLVPVLPPITAHPAPWLVCLVLAVGGSAIAPMFATSNSRLAAVAPPERRGEAFGWFATASTMGGALSAPLVGAILDHAGPAQAAALAALLAVGAAMVARLVPG